MRLTLRTLLAGLDGVLDAERQTEFAGRLAGCATAQKLADRIRSVAGRVEIDPPRLDAWGTPGDPNRSAEYIDNRLPAEQIEPFERTCLESEPHLAEVGACHAMLAEIRLCRAVEVLPAAEFAARLKRRTRESLPTPAGERETIAAAAAAQAIASVARQILGNETSPRTVPVGPTAGGHAGATPPAARAKPSSHTNATPSPSLSSSAGGVATAAQHSVARGLPSPEHPVPEHVQKDSGHAPPRKKSKSATSPAAAARSERLVALGSLAALVAVGGLLVTWVGRRGLSPGPQRASLEGQVSFDGKPLEEGSIVLVPAGDTKGPTAGGRLSGGRFRIDAAVGPVVGRYRVEIKATRKTGRMVKSRIVIANRTEVEETEQFIPSRYNTASELEVDIKPGRNKTTLDLTSPPRSESKPGRHGPQPRVVSGRPGTPPVAAPLPKRAG